MRAIRLEGTSGFDSLHVIETARPSPGPGEVLIAVKAAGINYAELNQTYGRYPTPRPLPYIMGFEVAGVVMAVGSGVAHPRVGDRVVTQLPTGGGYAEYAVAPAASALLIPDGLTDAQATTIPIQGLTAYMLLRYAARPRTSDALLIPSAAGGVGLYLVQLAKILGVETVVAMASSDDKLSFVKRMGADHVVNSSEPGWAEHVERMTAGRGLDVVLVSAGGRMAEESIALAAPFGRIVMFGADNIHDAVSMESVRHLIYKNQTLVGFNIPSLDAVQFAESIPALLRLISERRIQIVADTAFPLSDVGRAFEALASRRTVGKVVLLPCA